jgi:hypothetical protein
MEWVESLPILRGNLKQESRMQNDEETNTSQASQNGPSAAAVCTVIPEIAWPSGDKLRVQVSVLLMPVASVSGDPLLSSLGTGSVPIIPLAAWPSTLMKRMRSKEWALCVRLADKKMAVAAVNAVDMQCSADDYEAQIRLADEKWRHVFGNDPQAFEALSRVLVEDAKARTIARNLPSVPVTAKPNLRFDMQPLLLKPPSLLKPAQRLDYSRTIAPNTDEIGRQCQTVMLSEVAAHIGRAQAANLASVTLGGSGEAGPIEPALHSNLRAQWLWLSKAFDHLRGDPTRHEMSPSDSRLSRNVAMLNKQTEFKQASEAYFLRPAKRETFADLLNLARQFNSTKDFSSADFANAFHELDEALQFERPSAEASPVKQPQDAAVLVDEPASDPQDIARRRLNALRSMPALAKLFRLLIDVVIEVPIPNGFDPKGSSNWIGRISAQLILEGKDDKPPPEPEDLVWTACRLSSSTRPMGKANAGQDALIFGPASNDEYAEAPTPLLEFGIVNLKAQNGRFKLRSYDATLLVKAVESRFKSQSELRSNGRLQSQVSDHLGNTYTPGITLIDTGVLPQFMFRFWQAALQPLRAKAHVNINNGQSETPLFAEDLLIGYRVDIQRIRRSLRFPHLRVGADKQVSVAENTWHTVTARSVRYNGVDVGKDLLYPDLRYREDGAVQPLIRMIKESDDPTSVTRQERTIKEFEDSTPVTRQELLTWTGNSMALPATADKHGTCFDIDAKKDLNIGVTYAFPPPSDSAAGLMPALRVGDAYRFVLRACYQNGGGPRFDAACLNAKTLDLNGRAWLDLYEKSALGAGQDEGLSSSEPFPFRIPDVTGAPDVAFLADDPVVKAKAKLLATACPGERLERVVLRYGDVSASRETIRRVLVPPRATFEQAEAQGQFDQDFQPIPVGALRDLDTSKDGAVLPQAVGGKIVEQMSSDDSSKTHVNPADTGGDTAWRGPVVRGAPGSGRLKDHAQYYCDARARCVVLAFARVGEAPDARLARLDQLVFWKEQEYPRDALPILLEFRLNVELTEGARILEDVDRIVATTSGARAGVAVRRVRIEVAVAEELDLVIWCPDLNAARNNPYFQTLAARLGSPTAVDSVNTKTRELRPEIEQVRDALSVNLNGLLKTAGNSQELIDENTRLAQRNIMMQWLGVQPLDVLNAITRIQVVGAVVKPRYAATYSVCETGGLSAPRLALQIIRLKQQDAIAEWDRRLAAQQAKDPKSTVPLTCRLDIEDDRGGEVGFLVARVNLDRPSTATLRGEVAWVDYDDAVALAQNAARTEWIHVPRHSVHELFKELQIERDSGGVSQDFDLTQASDSSPRNLSLTFGTGAKRLAFRLVSGSRFKDCFNAPKPIPGNPIVDLGYFERENYSLKELLKTPSCPGEFNMAQRDDAFWIKATERPPVLQVDSFALLAHEHFVAQTPRFIAVERRQALRVWFTRGSGYKSGEGELVAVVLLPQNDVSDLPEAGKACVPARNTFALDPGEQAVADELRRRDFWYRPRGDPSATPIPEAVLKLVTGWGADPTMLGGQLQNSIPPSQFSGWVAKRGNLTLPVISDDGSSGGDSAQLVVPVAVIAYLPQLDRITGRWYIDIDFMPPPVDSAFVAFSLARYQPNALVAKDNGELCLSPSTRLDAVRIHPERRVEVTITQQFEIRVTVRGSAYARRSVSAPSTGDEVIDAALGKAMVDAREKTDLPYMHISLCRQPEFSDDAVVPVTDADGELLSRDAEPVLNVFNAEWTANWFMPKNIPISTICVYVSEFEWISTVDFHPLDDTSSALIRRPREFKCLVALGKAGNVFSAPSPATPS